MASHGSIKSNKRSLVWLSAILIGIVIVLLAVPRNKPDPLELAQTPSQKQPANITKRPLKKIREIINQRVVEQQPGNLNRAIPDHKSDATIPEPCLARWRGFAGMNLSEFIGTITAEQSNSPCREEEATLFAASSKSGLTSCLSKAKGVSQLESVPFGSHTNECLTGLRFLRASIIERLYEGMETSQLPTPVLANLLFLNFQDSADSPEKHQAALKFVEELAIREPDLYFAHKARAVLYLSAPGTINNSGQEPRGLGEALAACREFATNDPEVDEMAFMRHAINGNPEQMVAEARRVLEENPNSALAHYYLASEAFKKGDREAALRSLETAQRLAPTDTRIKDTIERARTAAPGDKIFSWRLSFSFDDGSL